MVLSCARNVFLGAGISKSVRKLCFLVESHSERTAIGYHCSVVERDTGSIARRRTARSMPRGRQSRSHERNYSGIIRAITAYIVHGVVVLGEKSQDGTGKITWRT